MAQLSSPAALDRVIEPGADRESPDPGRAAAEPGPGRLGTHFLHADAVTPLLGLLIGPGEAGAAEAWFDTLADATRLRILQALSLTTEWCVGDLALALGLSVSALSHQLRYLLDRGVVTRRRSGRIVFYALADAHVRHVLRDALAHASEQPAEIA